MKSRPKSIKGDSSERTRIPLWMTQEEAEVLLTLLLQAPPTPEAPADVAERILYRVAGVQRAFSRAATARKRRPTNVLIVSRRLLAPRPCRTRSLR